MKGPKGMAVDKDGKILPIDDETSYDMSIDILRRGELLLVVSQTPEGIGMNVMGKPTRRILEHLEQAIQAYRTVVEHLEKH